MGSLSQMQPATSDSANQADKALSSVFQSLTARFAEAGLSIKTP